MQIINAQVGNVIYPLVEGQPFPINVGQTLRVFYSFKYKMPESGSVRLWASLYYYTILGFFEREEKAQTKGTIALEKALDWRDYSGSVDIIISSDCTPDIYGLILELPDYKDVADKREACVEVAKAPNIFDMIGPLLVLGLLAGMMPMLAPKEENE